MIDPRSAPIARPVEPRDGVHQRQGFPNDCGGAKRRSSCGSLRLSHVIRNRRDGQHVPRPCGKNHSEKVAGRMTGLVTTAERPQTPQAKPSADPQGCANELARRCFRRLAQQPNLRAVYFVRQVARRPQNSDELEAKLERWFGALTAP